MLSLLLLLQSVDARLVGILTTGLGSILARCALNRDLNSFFDEVVFVGILGVGLVLIQGIIDYFQVLLLLKLLAINGRPVPISILLFEWFAKGAFDHLRVGSVRLWISFPMLIAKHGTSKFLRAVLDAHWVFLDLLAPQIEVWDNFWALLLTNHNQVILVFDCCQSWLSF